MSEGKLCWCGEHVMTANQIRAERVEASFRSPKQRINLKKDVESRSSRARIRSNGFTDRHFWLMHEKQLARWTRNYKHVCIGRDDHNKRKRPTPNTGKLSLKQLYEALSKAADSTTETNQG